MFFTCHLGIICSLVGHGIGRNQNKLLKQKFFLEKKKLIYGVKKVLFGG